MERSPHVLLVGDGADTFASEHGLEPIGQDYFHTEHRWEDLQRFLKRQVSESLCTPDHKVLAEKELDEGDSGKGTVGCVALDWEGRLAAATSTGGMNGKLPGRVGDTPVIGAGTYANRVCAVSCTGNGEAFIRHTIAVRIAWLVAEQKMNLDEAVNHCLDNTLRAGDGGIIAVDRAGNVSMSTNTGAMPRGVADFSGRCETAIWY
jgi:beta-aspartyl-peptidase (threonine type)